MGGTLSVKLSDIHIITTGVVETPLKLTYYKRYVDEIYN